MHQPIRYVGLDVHSTSISIAVAEEGRGEPTFLTRLPNHLTRLLKSLDRLGPRSSLHCAYEAGPTGYGLQRALTRTGIRCEVIAPSKMPRKRGDQVKTDRKDAVRLAHCLRAGDLVAVHVPEEACEAMRDLLRAREDAASSAAVRPSPAHEVPAATGQALAEEQVDQASPGVDRAAAL